jgi:type I restriction enzyme M protein
VAEGYVLNLNRYKEQVYEEVEYRDPRVILKDLAELEKEILHGIGELDAML